MEKAVKGESIIFDKKRLIWAAPNDKLCFNCSLPGHNSTNCRRSRTAPKDRNTQQLYQRYQPAQFKNYQAPKISPKTTPTKPTNQKDGPSYAKVTHNSKDKKTDNDPKPKLIDKNASPNTITPIALHTSLDDSMHVPPGSWADDYEEQFIHERYHQKPQKEGPPLEKIDQILLLLETTNAQLAIISQDLSFTVKRVEQMELILGIHTLTPEKAKKLNEMEKRNPSNNNAMIEDSPYEPDIDATESIIYGHTGRINELSGESHSLKMYLGETTEKLNVALKTVSILQNMVFNNLNVDPKKKLAIPVLLSPSHREYDEHKNEIAPTPQFFN